MVDGKVLVRFATVRRSRYVTLAGQTHVVAVGRLYASKGYAVAWRPVGATDTRWRLLSGPWPTSARAVVEFAGTVDRLTADPSPLEVH